VLPAVVTGCVHGAGPLGVMCVGRVESRELAELSGVRRSWIG
jgi:hypothetical protein